MVQIARLSCSLSLLLIHWKLPWWKDKNQRVWSCVTCLSTYLYIAYTSFSIEKLDDSTFQDMPLWEKSLQRFPIVQWRAQHLRAAQIAGLNHRDPSGFLQTGRRGSSPAGWKRQPWPSPIASEPSNNNHWRVWPYQIISYHIISNQIISYQSCTCVYIYMYVYTSNPTILRSW